MKFGQIVALFAFLCRSRYVIHCLRYIDIARITTSDGHSIPWTDEIRYLGIIVAGRHLKCPVTHAKRSFHRSINAIFGEEVISMADLQKRKCANF